MSKLPRYIVRGCCPTCGNQTWAIINFQSHTAYVGGHQSQLIHKQWGKSLHYILEEIASSPMLITQRNSFSFSISKDIFGYNLSFFQHKLYICIDIYTSKSKDSLVIMICLLFRTLTLQGNQIPDKKSLIHFSSTQRNFLI